MILRDGFRSCIQLWNEKALIKKLFLLSQVPILSTSTVQYLGHLARFCDRVVLNQGADILRAGTEPDKVYLITKGTCLLEKALTLVRKRAPGSAASKLDEQEDVKRLAMALRLLPQVRSQAARVDIKSRETVYEVSISIGEVYPFPRHAGTTAHARAAELLCAVCFVAGSAARIG